MCVYTIGSADSDEITRRLIEDHPKGTIITIIRSTCTFDPIQRGSQGEVLCIDRAGSLHVSFNGKNVCLNYEFGDRWAINGHSTFII